MIRKRLAMDQSKVEDLEARFKSVLDADKDGGIDLPEACRPTLSLTLSLLVTALTLPSPPSQFLNAMPELGKESPALAKRLFSVFDHDNSGKISVEELLAGLANLCQGNPWKRTCLQPLV